MKMAHVASCIVLAVTAPNTVYAQNSTTPEEIDEFSLLAICYGASLLAKDSLSRLSERIVSETTPEQNFDYFAVSERIAVFHDSELAYRRLLNSWAVNESWTESQLDFRITTAMYPLSGALEIRSRDIVSDGDISIDEAQSVFIPLFEMADACALNSTE